MRFPEFSDEWEYIPNKQLFAIVNKRNSDLQRDLVLSASQSLGMICRAKIGIDIKYKEESISTYKLVNKGDYIIHLRSFQGGFAFSDIDGVCSPAYTILRPIGGLYYGFLREYFRSTSFINSLVPVTYGIRDGRSISVEEWMLGDTILPSLPEQEKIASFLSLIDERIEAQRQIIKEYKKQKKALLHQLFSQSLRFPEFSDEWQQTTLGVVCTIKTGKLDANAMVEGGSYPFFTCAKQTYQTDTYSFSGEAILVAGNGEVGLTKYYNGKFNAYQRTYVLQSVRGDIILLFIRNYIDYTLPKRIISLLNGSAMPYITLSTLSDTPLPLPSLAEQKKIAELFTIFDERIEVEEALLACYETQKRYLLRQMFI